MAPQEKEEKEEGQKKDLEKEKEKKTDMEKEKEEKKDMEKRRRRRRRGRRRLSLVQRQTLKWTCLDSIDAGSMAEIHDACAEHAMGPNNPTRTSCVPQGNHVCS